MSHQNHIDNYIDPNALTEDDLIAALDADKEDALYFASLSASEAQELVQNILDNYLEPRFSELLKAKFFGECDNESIRALMKITGVSYKNTHKRYYQAMAAFRKVLETEFYPIYCLLETPAIKKPGPAKGSKRKKVDSL